MKHVFYEEDGQFKVGAVLTTTDSNLQVEAPHGKRSKIRKNAVLFEFNDNLNDFLPQATTLSEDIELEFLWSCAPEDEFHYSQLAVDYFGESPKPLEQAALILKLHSAPMYFYRKGKGHYKSAPESSLKAALAGIEKKQREQEQVDAWIQMLREGQLPESWRSMVAMLLTRPDKNTLEFKALEHASRLLETSPLTLIWQCGGIASIPDFFVSSFLLAHFSKGGEFPNFELPAVSFHDLPHSNVAAFSLDDASTTEIDDAFSVTHLDNGDLRVGIHIAAPTLGILAHSELEHILFQRLSTVYFPGGKVTLLPHEVCEQFSLDEGKTRPVFSIYFDYSPEFEQKNAQTCIETITIANNLRNEHIAPFFNTHTIEQPISDTPNFPFERECRTLWQLSGALETKRLANKGEPNTQTPKIPRAEYSFIIEHEHVRIVPRERGAPIDRLVSELMIAANQFWGEFLSKNATAGIYRTQMSGKVKMSTAPAPHTGLGVEFYAWCTSPLRRAIDFVNQAQLLGILLETAPRFAKNDPQLFGVIRDFEIAYGAYGEFESKMERYWSLKYLLQESIKQTQAIVLKEQTVRIDHIPIVHRLSDLPSDLQIGDKVHLQILDIDLLNLTLEARFINKVDPSETI